MTATFHRYSELLVRAKMKYIPDERRDRKSAEGTIMNLPPEYSDTEQSPENASDKELPNIKICAREFEGSFTGNASRVDLRSKNGLGEASVMDFGISFFVDASKYCSAHFV